MKTIPQKSLSFTILLGLFAGLPALSIDLSAPTLAILPRALDTTVSVAGLSLSLFMVGFACGQFAGGRTSDQLGRRPVLLAALMVYVFSGICCSFATTGGQLATARFAQGLGAGGCSVQAFAIVQDVFRGEAARRKQSYVTVVLAIMPMIAPAIGAMLLSIWGWRSVHVVLAAGGLALALTVLTKMQESRPGNRVEPTDDGLLSSWRSVRSNAFLKLVVINGFSYGSVFAYIAGAPVVIMTQFGFSNYVYAAVFASTALSLSAGAFVNARWAQQFGGSQGVFLAAQALAAIVLVIISTAVSPSNAWELLPPLLVFCFARGVISPNISYLAISMNRSHAGLASATLGFGQLLLGAAASAVVAGLLPMFGLTGVTLVMALLSAAAALIWTTSAAAGAARRYL